MDQLASPRAHGALRRGLLLFRHTGSPIRPSLCLPETGNGGSHPPGLNRRLRDCAGGLPPHGGLSRDPELLFLGHGRSSTGKPPVRPGGPGSGISRRVRSLLIGRRQQDGPASPGPYPERSSDITPLTNSTSTGPSTETTFGFRFTSSRSTSDTIILLRCRVSRIRTSRTAVRSRALQV